MPYKDKVKQKEFSKRHYLLNKEVYQQSRKQNRNNRHIWFNGVKSQLKCCQCGENDYRCLDFHHREFEEKVFGISEGVKSGYSEEKIIKEISKCDVLCANCHRKKHASVRLPADGYHRERVGKNIKWLREFKRKLSCVDCGIKDEFVLDFHHLRDKDDTICRLAGNGCSVERLLEEIAKCEVICANCHRKRHNGNVWSEDSVKN
jgi:hypothetical protein